MNNFVCDLQVDLQFDLHVDLVLTFRLAGLEGNLLDLIVRRFTRDMKCELFKRRLGAIRTIADLHDNRPAVVLSVMTAMDDQNVSNIPGLLPLSKIKLNRMTNFKLRQELNFSFKKLYKTA